MSTVPPDDNADDLAAVNAATARESPAADPNGFDEEEEKTSPGVVRVARAGRGFEEQNPKAVIAVTEPTLRQRLVELLWADGYNAMEANSVEELLEIGKAVAPQVALIDATWVTTQGLPIAEALRQRVDTTKRQDAVIRTVALLADTSFAAIAGALADGFDDFIVDTANDVEVLARATANLRAGRAQGELQKQRRDASLMLELSQALASSLDMQLILHTVSRLVAEVIALERCSIVLLDPDHDDAIMVAASEDRAVKDLRIRLSNYPELRRCVESAAPVLIDDATTEPMLVAVQKSLIERNIRTMALFPIVFEERVTGVLFLRSGRQTSRRFSQSEVQFGQTVASACAVAIRNARLFDQFRDQTERINSMRMLAEKQNDSLKKYQDFFEYAADGMAIIDGDGRLLYVNQEGRRLLGRSREELLTLRFADLLLPESKGSWLDLASQAGRGRFKHSFDVFVGRADGGARVFSLSAGSGGGQETGLIILSFRDVTETREMEGELRTTKEFLENLIDNSVDAICACDMRGNIMLFNKGAERIFGYRAEEVIGKMHVSKLYPPNAATDIMHRLRDARWGGRGRLETHRREIINVDGEVVPVSMAGSIIYEDGTEVATVGVFSDLRDRMAIERELSDAKEELSRTEKARVAAELAGMAAHELNQPLTSVLGYAEMLRSRVPENDDKLRRPVDTIFRQAERMAEIVRKIGRITKYKTKAYGPNTDMIDLNRATIDGDHDDGGFAMGRELEDPPTGPAVNPLRNVGAESAPNAIAMASMFGRGSPQKSSDPRSLIVRQDTVDPPSNYQRAHRAAKESAKEAPKENPFRDDDATMRHAPARIAPAPVGPASVTASQRMAPVPSQPTRTPPPRPKTTVSANVASTAEEFDDEDTDPGLRLSDIKKTPKPEG